MANMTGYSIIIVLLAKISECHWIGMEYYDDKNIPDLHPDNNIKSKARRINDGNKDKWINPEVVKNNPIDYPNSIGEHYLLNIVSKQRQEEVQVSFNTTLCVDPKSNLFTSSVKDNCTSYTNITMRPSDLLNEYEYIYDDDTQPPILRQQLQNTDHDEATDQIGPNIKNPLTEFYNLDPAVQQMNLEVDFNLSKSQNVWYTIENMPCWELPLLYGEFGKKKKTHEVFLIGGGELRNVIEKKDNKLYFSRRPTNVPLSYYTSKWCTVEPCYGDHTLCLFSDNEMSSLCDKHYKVVVPNILEQTALVNTLNSMRNSVANGKSARYSHLPPAANMKQILYDTDLQQIAKVWLYQCLPGPAPCSALDGSFVTQLECTKYATHCCVNAYTGKYKKCTPIPECFLLPLIGCLHVWYWSAGDNLTATDVQCSHTSVQAYYTAQLLWANTYKIGCAYAQYSNGDVRVVCNFSPGAPFMLDTKYYCGIIGHKKNANLAHVINITDTKFLRTLGINLNEIVGTAKNATPRESKLNELDNDFKTFRGVHILSKIYSEGWIRKELNDYSNGTKSLIARLVVKYRFIEHGGARCDSNQPIYVVGAPGSLCVEKGRRYHALCYDFRDPTPGYRLVAVIAPIILFSLILYDLFSGVVRQTNY